MASVTINGSTISPDPNADGTPNPGTSQDAKDTKYICIQSNGALDNEQKVQLNETFGVEFQYYEGNDTHLCRYPPRDLERLRALPYVRYTNVYHINFKTTPHTREELQSKSSTSIVISLHKGARSPQELAKDLAELPGVQRDTIATCPS